MEDLDTTLDKIKAGLTGDKQKDIAYLLDEAQKYKEAPNGKEIVKAISQLAYDTLDDDEKKRMSDIYNSDHAKYVKQSQEIVKAYQQGKLDVAKKACEDFLEETKDIVVRETDSEIHQCFNEPIEQVIYTNNFKPSKNVVPCDIPYSQVYYYYGYILNDLDRAEDAKAAFEEARKWNQVAVAPIFELGEYYRFRDEDKFIDLAKESLKYSYRKPYVSHSLRNIAFGLIDQGEYEASLSLFMMALAYQPDDQETMAEMHYLEEKQGEPLHELTYEDIERISQEKKYPIGPDPELLESLYGFGLDRYKEKDYRMAEYFLSFYYDLTEDPYVKETFDDIRKKLATI